MAEKLTKAQREQIIFAHLKGQDNPLYEVTQTKYGKYVVKPKQIQVEEETINEEPEEEEEEEPKPQPVKQSYERRKRNRHAKQDAKRILDALTHLINSNDGDYESSDESSDDDRPRAPPLVDQPNVNPGPIIIRRKRLAF